jgi:hypothetical protein
MKQSSFFYTNAEISRMKNLIRTGEPLSHIAEREYQSFGAPTPGSFRQKLTKVAKTTYKIKEWEGPKKKISKKEESVTTQEVLLPEGFSFEGAPKKVTVCADHFRVYF